MAEESRGTQSNPEREQPARYSREQIGEYARSWFDVSPAVLVGALAESERETFTKKQAEDALKSHLRKSDPPDGSITHAEAAS